MSSKFTRSMLDTLVTSKTRLKLLLRFFTNPGSKAYLRGLEQELGESSNAIRIELNRLEGSGMLTSYEEGNRKMFQVNSLHPLYNEISSIVKKYMGIDVIIDNIANRLGKPNAVYLGGNLAKGMESDVLDMIIVGEIDRVVLNDLIYKAENLLRKKIKFLVYSTLEASVLVFKPEEYLLLWRRDNSVF